ICGCVRIQAVAECIIQLVYNFKDPPFHCSRSFEYSTTHVASATGCSSEGVTNEDQTAWSNPYCGPCRFVAGAVHWTEIHRCAQRQWIDRRCECGLWNEDGQAGRWQPDIPRPKRYS